MTPIRRWMADRLPESRRGRGLLTGLALVAGAALWFVLDPFGGPSLQIKSPGQLHDYFVQRGYTMRALRAGGAEVPPVYITSVPANWADDLEVTRKKGVFFRALLPLVLRVNKDIAADRARLDRLRKQMADGAALSRQDRDWLRDLAVRYKVVDREHTDAAPPPTQAELATLTARVDIIPPSLALAQSAIESAYGTSRFAVEGNALFGQWTFGKGLRPEAQRKSLGDYRVARFDTPLASVRGYARNLNTNPAYRSFRQLRLRARMAGQAPRGPALLPGLSSYSERGQAYVAEVRGLIDTNQLAPMDTARLNDGPAIELRAGLF